MHRAVLLEALIDNETVTFDQIVKSIRTPVLSFFEFLKLVYEKLALDMMQLFGPTGVRRDDLA